jgi:Fic family protein
MYTHVRYGHMIGTPHREYRTSHPWLTFAQVDLRWAGAEFWMLLGEARSKVEHLSMALLRPDVREEMLKVFLAKGVHATTAIEGNTLSEEEVVKVVEGRANPPSSQEYLYREVENVIAAYNRIKDSLLAGADPTLTIESIKEFDREVLDGIDEDGVTPGEIRNRGVVVGGRYLGAPAVDCEYLLEKLCEWLASPDFAPPEPGLQIPYALIKAVVAHLYLVWIHPFDNGNGRTARLIELQVLMAAGVPMPAAHLLSNHYNITREEYYRQLQQASDSGGDVTAFLRYAIQGFVDGIRGQVDFVWGQQYDDRWQQFIYESFRGRPSSEAERRRFLLATKLSERWEPVARRDIPSLDPSLAAAYNDTQRMLSRDLNALEELGLIEQAGHGHWQVAREQILAFRPLRLEAGLRASS